MKRKIESYEIVDHGVENSQYFQGCGVMGSDYDECFTGVGNSLKDALEDATNQMHDVADNKDLDKEIEKASDKDTVYEELSRSAPQEEWVVTHYSRSMGSELKHEVFDTEEEAQDFAETRRNWLKNKKFTVEEVDDNIWEITEPEDAMIIPQETGYIKIVNNLDEIEKFYEQDHELYYYASILIKYKENTAESMNKATSSLKLPPDHGKLTCDEVVKMLYLVSGWISDNYDKVSSLNLDDLALKIYDKFHEED